MRSSLALISLLTLLFLRCDQAPSTLEEEPYKEPVAGTEFTLEIISFDFDFLSRQFFFSVAITNPPENAVFDADLITSAFAPITLAPLNDAGLEGDILINDELYDGNWILPESMTTYVDSQWTLVVRSSVGTLTATQNLQPQRPLAPRILSVIHRDSLTLASNGAVFDTIYVKVTHDQGLDEIRDVSFMNRKPDGTLAGGGNPIPLHDDGGSKTIFTIGNVAYTSGDSVAGDSIYTLIAPLLPNYLSGTYHMSFSSRSWLGMTSEIVEDSLVVLPPLNMSRAKMTITADQEIFK